MSVATLSLAALLVAVLVSCVSEINIGVLAIVLAWIVGVGFGGMTLAQLTAGFPSQIFLTLVGVTLLFGLANANGTLERITARAVRLCGGRRGLIPLMFFLVTLVLSSAGPGNIAASALMVPLALSAAGSSGISPLLMSVMVANGASGGSLSPFAPAGIVVNGIMGTWGIPNVAAYNYLNNVLVHTLVAMAGFVVLGGVRLFRGVPTPAPAPLGADAARETWVPAADPFESRHVLTALVLAALIVSVVIWGVNVGMAAFVGAVILTVCRASDQRQAIARMPWNVILMISGVSMLVAVLEKTGGADLATSLLAQASSPSTIIPIAALLSGGISIFSSTSGVVLPALIPLVPGLVERVGGGTLLGVASAMNVSGHLVDVSPLSTLGALCLASAPASADTRRLFNSLLAWGVSMTVVGALVSWLLFGVLGLP